MRRFLTTLALVALASAGCKKSEGDRCEGWGDCREELTCVEWDETHEEVLGKCDGDKCCVGARRAEQVEQARKKRWPGHRAESSVLSHSGDHRRAARGLPC